MISRIEEAQKLDARAKKLRREEQSFWREVSDRRIEVIQYLGCSIGQSESSTSNVGQGVEGIESTTLGEPTIYAESHIHSGLSIGETECEGVI